MSKVTLDLHAEAMAKWMELWAPDGKVPAGAEDAAMSALIEAIAAGGGTFGEARKAASTAQDLCEVRLAEERILAILTGAYGSDAAEEQEEAKTGAKDGNDAGKGAEAKGATGRKKGSIATRIVEGCVRDGVVLFQSQFSEPYAEVPADGHMETLSMESRAFRQWIARRHFITEGRAPNATALSDAITVLCGKALYEGERCDVYNRVAWHDGAIYYDLTDAAWRAVRIDRDGWRVVTKPPVHFGRQQHHAPQVEPVPGGNLQELDPFLNFEGPEYALPLFRAILVAALIPDIPHPILELHGPKGSAKSTTFVIEKRLVDPSCAETLTAHRDIKDMVRVLSHHWFAGFDNLGTISEEVSDMFCRAVTGDGFECRSLYTNDDAKIFAFRRCVALNGINIVGTRPDFLDRAILMACESIPKERRREDAEVKAAFEVARPHILGAMFSALSGAIRRYPDVQLSGLPRLADFCRWGCAIAETLGERDAFLHALDLNREEQNAEALDAHPVAKSLIYMMKEKTRWEGTPEALLTELRVAAEAIGIDTKDKSWPKAAHTMSRRLREVKPNLADSGLCAVDSTPHGGRRWTITKNGKAL